MPAIAAIALNDGATPTPAPHTFSPVTTNGSKAEYADRAPTTPNGYRKLQYTLEPPSGQRTTYKMTLGIHNPTEATVDGSVVVVRYQAGSLTLNFAPDSTAQERLDTIAYVRNFLSDATVKTSVQNLEPFY